MNEEMTMDSNIYVIDVDMKNRNADDIAKDAANQIAALCDKLFEEMSINKNHYKNVKD